MKCIVIIYICNFGEIAWVNSENCVTQLGDAMLLDKSGECPGTIIRQWTFDIWIQCSYVYKEVQLTTTTIWSVMASDWGPTENMLSLGVDRFASSLMTYYRGSDVWSGRASGKLYASWLEVVPFSSGGWFAVMQNHPIVIGPTCECCMYRAILSMCVSTAVCLV